MTLLTVYSFRLCWSCSKAVLFPKEFSRSTLIPVLDLWTVACYCGVRLARMDAPALVRPPPPVVPEQVV